MNNFLKNFDSIVNDVLKQFKVPGAAIGITVENKVILQRGYGFRDYEKKLPVTEKTVFSIGSCTKAFTSLMLSQLLEEGLLQWDDPVVKFIPEFRLFNQELTAKVTIRDVLAHRSGISRHDAIWISYNPKANIPRVEVLKYLNHFEPINELREKFQYNNFMYSVAGLAIERITGKAWEEILHKKILMPLGMNNTHASHDFLQTECDFALPYAEINEKISELPFYNLFPIAPAGAMQSNILDMLKWISLQLLDKEMLKKQIIAAKSLKEMHAIHMHLPLPKDEETKAIKALGYGLGWFVGNYSDYPIVYHSGSVDGFCCEMALLPEKKIGLVILTNSGSDGGYVFSVLINIILDNILGVKEGDWINKIKKEREKEKLGKLKNTHREHKKNSSVLSAPATPLGDYVGNYENPAYGRIEIYLQNNNLYALYQGVSYILKYKDNHVFTKQFKRLLNFGESPEIDYSFIKNATDKHFELQVAFEGFCSGPSVVFTLIHKS